MSLSAEIEACVAYVALKGVNACSVVNWEKCELLVMHTGVASATSC